MHNNLFLVAHGDGFLRPLLLVLVVQEGEPKQGAGGNNIHPPINGEALERRARSRTALDFIEKEERFPGNETKVRMGGTDGGKNCIGPQVIAEDPRIPFIIVDNIRVV